MSHELRTPLNSILILGQQLAENADGKLSSRQVEFATTIHGAGTDLLNLISDILDLSKIESGTVTVECEDLLFTHLRETIERNFRHEADARQLSFTADFDTRLGRAITTDSKRLLQVLKNLLSNALKFTERGGVRLHVGVATVGWSPEHPILREAPSVVEFSVSDTGIGIPPEKQRIIFEAFQQADAGTARKYGGTGLGLAISRELAHLLGGEIRLSSISGSGSTFTLYLPLSYLGPAYHRAVARDPAAAATAVAVFQPVVLPVRQEQIADDREDLQPEDAVLLVVEDDPHYCRILLDLARQRGFKILLARTGADALTLAHKYRPSAVSLDVFLPDMPGFELLAQVQQDGELRRTPVVVFTGRELTDAEETELRKAAKSIVLKGVRSPERLLDETALFLHRVIADLPEAKQRMIEALHESDEPLSGRKVLVVDDDIRNIFALNSLLERHSMQVITATNGQEAIKLVESTEDLSLVLMDVMMPEMDGYETMRRIRSKHQFRQLPIIALTAKAMKGDREKCLEAGASDYVAKPVNTEQLLSLIRTWLHR